MRPVDCDVYWGHIGSLAEEHVALLDRSELARRGRYRQQADADRFALGAALLRIVLSGRLDLAPDCIDVDRTCVTCGKPHGKPRVRDGGGGRIETSVAHSGDYVAVAVTESRRVGVDVEVVKPLDYPPLLAAVCVAEEAGGVRSLEDFYTCWTRKESLLKALGVGLSIPMPRLRLTPPGQPPRVLRAADGFPGPAALVDVSPAEGYVGAVAVLATKSVRVHSQSARELLASC